MLPVCTLCYIKLSFESRSGRYLLCKKLIICKSCFLLPVDSMPHFEESRHWKPLPLKSEDGDCKWNQIGVWEISLKLHCQTMFRKCFFFLKNKLFVSSITSCLHTFVSRLSLRLVFGVRLRLTPVQCTLQGWNCSTRNKLRHPWFG